MVSFEDGVQDEPVWDSVETAEWNRERVVN